MPIINIKSQNLKREGPVMDIVVSASERMAKGKLGLPTETISLKALIDTGASCSALSSAVIKQLALEPVGESLMNTPSHSKVPCKIFDIRMIMPDNVRVKSVLVIEAPLEGQNIQCLIGRDILGLGILVYNGQEGLFSLSF
ncbi:MAG: retroviral-like aspartic protease family protein [Fibromonadaceae bacterium]|jgi:predicted aspartyl protease|nr:retroviral-like aspartic protease family protein [Fibromonadaceae bacterium]